MSPQLTEQSPASVIVSVLPNIFPFLNFDDINDVLSRVSPQFYLNVLRFQYQLFHTPNRCCLFNNIFFDASTGSKIFDFSDREVVQHVFDTLYTKHYGPVSREKKVTIIYTHIPSQFQNTEPVVQKKVGSLDSTLPSSPNVKQPQGQTSSNSSSNTNTPTGMSPGSGSNLTKDQQFPSNPSKDSSSSAGKALPGEDAVTHMFPITAFNDSPDLGYQFTNYSCLYLHDQHFVYVMYGNILGCFDLLGRCVRWSELVDEKLPSSKRINYLFVNGFMQTEHVIIIQLPQQVVCFDKKNGMKVNMIVNDPITKFHMINEKRERVSSITSFTEQTGTRKEDHLDGLCVLIGENIVRDKSIDFTKLTSVLTEDQTKQLTESRGSNAVAVTGSIPNSHDPTNSSVPHTTSSNLISSRGTQHIVISPVTSSEITQTTSSSHNYAGAKLTDTNSRKATVYGFIEKPKLYLFDGTTWTVSVSASGQSRDRHMLFKPQKAPVSCIVNEYEGEMRVVNREGKRTHIIDIKKLCENTAPGSKSKVKPLTFKVIADWTFLVGDKTGWAIIQPDIGRILHLNQLVPGIAHDKIFLVEKHLSDNKAGIPRLDGFISIQKEERTLTYYEFIESSSTFNKKWCQTLSWKKDAQFMFEFSHIHFSISAPLHAGSNEESRVFVFSRQVIDQRRFLTIQQRLDVQLHAINLKDGTTRWAKVHECYHGSGGDLSEAEKGFDISFCRRYTCRRGDDKGVTTPQLCLVRSFFSPIVKPDKGVAICVAYRIEDGEVQWTYNEKRKGVKFADELILPLSQKKDSEKDDEGTDDTDTLDDKKKKEKCLVM